MSFQQYRRTAIAEMRPYVPGEDLTGISVSDVDTPSEGGFIARNPDNHADQWYVAETYAKKNFDLASNAHAPVKGYKPMAPQQIAWMNAIKEMGAAIGSLHDALLRDEDVIVDLRWLDIAKTDLQQGFMALTRSVAKPDFF